MPATDEKKLFDLASQVVGDVIRGQRLVGSVFLMRPKNIAVVAQNLAALILLLDAQRTQQIALDHHSGSRGGLVNDKAIQEVAIFKRRRDKAPVIRRDRLTITAILVTATIASASRTPQPKPK